MDLGLRGKSAVVTGGSAGIGAAIVQTLAKEGCNVRFCARSGEKIRAQAAAIAARKNAEDGEVVGAIVDVCDKRAIVAWFDTIGEIDILVSTVSALSGDWEAAITTDLRGTVNVIEAALPRLTPGSSITYIGSKASSFGTPSFEAYGSIKAAIAHYVKSTAAKLVPNGVRVNVVSPGDTFVEGGFWDGIRRNAPRVYEAALAENPMGRFARPEEIARAVAFIASPAASFVSGANWYVDGGSTRHVQF
jgi:3-oxoacyl-[acyl-carrier protein] reductase